MFVKTNNKMIDCKDYANRNIANIRKEVLSRGGNLGALHVIAVSPSKASEIYIKNKSIVLQKCPINTETKVFDINAYERDIIDYIEELNKSKDVSGIMVQLPLPKHFNERKILDSINPQKDVDCLTNYSLGQFYTGESNRMPCTTKGIHDLLLDLDIELQGKKAVVIGRSNIVGKPTAMMLSGLDMTVTLAHSKTRNLKKLCKESDIIISAIGIPKMITKEYIKDGAIVIDVGINRDEDNKLCGDVDLASVIDKVSLITPVPNGVGRLTTLSLAKNMLI